MDPQENSSIELKGSSENFLYSINSSEAKPTKPAASDANSILSKNKPASETKTPELRSAY